MVILALAATHVDVASEFLATAQDALRDGRTRVFADTLFSATELVAKADLLLLPLPGFTKKLTHRRIESKVHLLSVSGRVPEGFKDAFNELGKLRRDTRYLDSPYSISDESAKRLLRTVQERLDEIRQDTSLALSDPV